MVFVSSDPRYWTVDYSCIAPSWAPTLYYKTGLIQLSLGHGVWTNPTDPGLVHACLFVLDYDECKEEERQLSSRHVFFCPHHYYQLLIFLGSSVDNSWFMIGVLHSAQYVCVGHPLPSFIIQVNQCVTLALQAGLGVRGPLAVLSWGQGSGEPSTSEQWLRSTPVWVMISWGFYYTEYIGDYNNPRTGNPELNQPGFNGIRKGVWTLLKFAMIPGWTRKCPRLLSLKWFKTHTDLALIWLWCALETVTSEFFVLQGMTQLRWCPYIQARQRDLWGKDAAQGIRSSRIHRQWDSYELAISLWCLWPLCRMSPILPCFRWQNLVMSSHRIPMWQVKINAPLSGSTATSPYLGCFTISSSLLVILCYLMS